MLLCLLDRVGLSRDICCCCGLNVPMKVSELQSSSVNSYVDGVWRESFVEIGLDEVLRLGPSEWHQWLYKKGIMGLRIKVFACPFPWHPPS